MHAAKKREPDVAAVTFRVPLRVKYLLQEQAQLNGLSPSALARKLVVDNVVPEFHSDGD